MAQLDVEAASASNTFRVFPLKNAAADRAGRVLQDLFTQREKVAALRPEDRLVISTDARTNSLFVSSSARSLAVVDQLLKTIDSEDASPSVSLHILPVEGADVTQLCSVLLRHGARQLAVIERDLCEWMDVHEYESVQQLKGSLSQKNCDDPSAFERAQYMRAISSFPVPPARPA